MKTEVSSRNDCTMVLVHIRSLREARVGIEETHNKNRTSRWRATDTIVQSTFLHTRGLILKSFRKEG